jgi:hypothetical protein
MEAFGIHLALQQASAIVATAQLTLPDPTGNTDHVMVPGA